LLTWAKEKPKTDDIRIIAAHGSPKAICRRNHAPASGCHVKECWPWTIKWISCFFDELGFGWLMDEDTLRKMREKESIEELLIQRSLAELFRKREPL
jgi:hypothetical protein